MLIFQAIMLIATVIMLGFVLMILLSVNEMLVQIQMHLAESRKYKGKVWNP